MPTRSTLADDVSEELRFRLERVAAYYRRCGETGEAPHPDFIDRELVDGTRDLLAAMSGQAHQAGLADGGQATPRAE